MSKIRTDKFKKEGFNKGAPLYKEIIWIFIKNIFFLSPWPWPSKLKRFLLILFGAKVGIGLYLRPRINIHYPWNLTIGNHCWIGEGSEILNLAPIVLEDYVAIAHFVYITSGSHDIKSKSMKYKNSPILISQGCWIASRSFICPGVHIGEYAVIGAGCIINKNIPPFSVMVSPEALKLCEREINRD